VLAIVPAPLNFLQFALRGRSFTFMPGRLVQQCGPLFFERFTPLKRFRFRHPSSCF
jgi:hypothetical protein